jgi:hypothetical protein
MTSVAVVDPVAPVYVVASVNAPCAVKFPVVPNDRFGPAIELITELITSPVANPVRAPVPLRAYGTLIADPSTTAYTQLGIVVAVHPAGAPTTETPLVVRVAVYPSGAVTTTENATVPVVGAIYVLIDAECVELVYTYEPTVPADAETALVLTSVVFVVVASYPVSASTTELEFPLPHTVDPVPYSAPAASAAIDASCGVVYVPLKLMVGASPVGNVYTLVDASAVGV